MMRSALAVVLVVGISSGAAEAQVAPGATRIVGQVMDHGNRKPIKSALVKLETMDGSMVVGTTETDGNGRFMFGEVSADLYAIRVERLGYGARSDTVRAVATQTVELTMTLAAKPVELAPIAVTVRSRWLELNGFYERRDMGGMKPHVIDRAMIERRGAPMLTDLLDQAAGVEVIVMGPGQRTIRFNRHTPMPAEAGKAQQSAFSPRRGPDERGCEPDLYIDGRQHRNASTGLNKVDDYNVLAPLVIEAVEIYIGNTPPQFHHNCGVILIWTRRGG